MVGSQGLMVRASTTVGPSIATLLCISYKQKHPGCKKVRGQSEAACIVNR